MLTQYVKELIQKWVNDTPIDELKIKLFEYPFEKKLVIQVPDDKVPNFLGVYNEIALPKIQQLDCLGYQLEILISHELEKGTDK